MCSLLSTGPMYSVFVLPSPWGKYCPVTQSQFIQILHHRLCSASVPYWDTILFRITPLNVEVLPGIPAELIHVFGDWASDAYKRYLQSDLPVKLRVYLAMT